MSTMYSNGETKNLRYHSQPTLIAGVTTNTLNGYHINETKRAVLTLNPQKSIDNALSLQTGYTAGMDYSIINCSLVLTSADGKTTGNLSAFMLSTGFDVDESVSWWKPTEKRGATLENWSYGGSVDALAENIVVNGNWSGEDITFDITPYVNIWKNSGKTSFSVIICSDESEAETWEFYSQQSKPIFIGKNEQTNVRFLGSGDTNTIDTEGILVKVSPYSPYLVVEVMETSDIALKRWTALNASVSIGNTFSMFLPDIKTESTTYTLIDKRTGKYGTQFVISGSTTGFSSEVQSAAEFSCNGTVPSGSGIVECANPNSLLKTELSALMHKDSVIFDYTPSVSPNNAKSFTVDFYSDETAKNGRIRLYVNEATVSENRTGLNTGIKRKSVKPRISLNLSL